VLQRIVWLNKKGVAFTFDFEQKKKGLENICPEWEEKNIAEIDRDTSSSVCYITPDEDFKELEGIKNNFSYFWTF
jgi:pyruvate-formate lyase